MPVDDWLGASKRVPLTALMVRRCDGLRTLEDGCASFGALAAISGGQTKSLFGPSRRTSAFGKTRPFAVVSGQAGDVNRMEGA